MTGFDYQHWLATAAGRSRRRAEAADLLHDAVLDAIRAGRTDFSQDVTRRWFAGVLRNRAAMDARSSVRRRQRETSRVAPRNGDDGGPLAPSIEFIRRLPAAARRVATLVVAGMNKDEIMSTLRLTNTAFRQRLTSIRRAWEEETDDESIRNRFPSQARGHVDLDLGLIRRALLQNVRNVGGIGTHDPDGHLIIIDSASPTSQLHIARQRKRNRTKG